MIKNKTRNMKQDARNTVAVIAIVATMIAVPVFAQSSSTAATSTRPGLTARLQNIVNRADQEIERRVNTLNGLSSRINSMVKLSDAEKSGLSSSIQSQIDEMNSLKSKVGEDGDLTSLKSDVQSITNSYRIYMLVVPQGTITAAADRAMEVASSVQAIGVKLQARLTAAQSAGHDVTALQTDLSDMNAKASDAITQAQAAIAEVTALTPDNGSSTLAQANTAALKDARTKIQTAMKDLQAARKDAGTIVQGLRAFAKPNASSTTSGNQ